MKTIQINENIAYLRTRAGISQEELADKLQVSSQAVSDWESGKCYPEIELLPGLADFFEISIDELLIGEISPEANPARAALMEQAIKLAQENGTICVSVLQRKLKVGYGAARRILDDMCKAGYITASKKGSFTYSCNDNH